MPSAKEKRIQERLQQIKDLSVALQVNAKTRADLELGVDLAEEAAGLGLEILVERKK